MINKANLKKRLVFVAFAVPVACVIVSSQFDFAAFARELFGISEKIMPKPIYPGQMLSLILVMMGTYEYIKMLSAANKNNGFWLGYLYILTMSTAYLLNRQIPGTISNSALVMMVAFEAFFFGREAPQGRWKRASLFLGGLILLNIASVGIMSLYRDPFQTLFKTPDNLLLGNINMVAVITAIFFCDSAAYFVGSAWGKRKLSATISPNKTIEGSLAGFATSVIFMSVCWIFIRNPEYSILIGVIMGVIIGAMAQVGDLLMSLIKRYFMVKDASHIIPGHGGILDRFDSVFFTAPVLYLYAWLLMKIGN